MADPIHPSERRDPRSALEKAKAGAQSLKVEVCPYQCTADDMDGHGYCRHLVGFTNANLPDGPVKDPKGAEVEALVEEGKRRVISTKREPLRKGDILMRITQSRRVYRDVDAKAEKAADKTTQSKPTPAPVG